MSFFRLLSVVGCAQVQEPAVTVAGVDNAPPIYASGILSVTIDARGSFDESAFPLLGQLDPDAGENCVPSYTARDYLTNGHPLGNLGYPQTSSVDQLPLPLDIGAGTVLTMPEAAEREIPPLFYLEDAWWGWIGGTWEVVVWEPPVFEIRLTGGETCEFREWALQLDTCLPDSGVLTFAPEEGDEDLELYLGGVGVGEGDRWPAPGGGFLCSTSHRHDGPTFTSP